MQAYKKSFVEQADDSLFSLYNLPYGVFSYESEPPRIGTAIGNFVLDLTQLEQQGLLHQDAPCFLDGTLNEFAARGAAFWSKIRARLQALLSVDHFELQSNAVLLEKVLIPKNQVTMHLPFKIEAFSDFYASESHATNVGRLFRGHANALLPNWKHLPVGYNGRASTVFVSGSPITRPMGLVQPPGQDQPMFRASQKLDFELELGFFVGVGNPGGERIGIHQAAQHIFGLVLLNDWSARDIQAFEYQPLGPFLSKSFATSISCWVVPHEALQPSMIARPAQVPTPVEYLYQNPVQQPDIKLKVELQLKGSAHRTVICETNSQELYWSMEQMLAHHTVNHCMMQPGDLLGTGTISGLERNSWGSLLEMTFNGTEPLQLGAGQTRTFLENGDTVIMTGYCQVGEHSIGLGELSGTIIPEKPYALIDIASKIS
jgi:fumarylacetoacetase